jgi:hypothetical protein
MSRQQIVEIVQEFRGLKLRPVESESSGDLIAMRGNTQIRLGFEKGRLSSHEISWVDGLLHATTLPATELCTAFKADR